jgi:hypothetical protein
MFVQDPGLPIGRKAQATVIYCNGDTSMKPARARLRTRSFRFIRHASDPDMHRERASIIDIVNWPMHFTYLIFVLIFLFNY